MRFKQRLARAGALVAAMAAVLAIGGIGASSALAAPTCVEDGTTITGRGSSLQKVAQQNIWAPAYNTACSATPNSVMYESTGSGPGLSAWGFTALNGISPEFGFIGTDDAPNLGNIVTALAQAPANSTLTEAEIETKIVMHERLAGTNALVIPVAQTAIAVPIHLPEGCSFVSGKGITSTDLTEIFGGTYTSWSEVANLKGGEACEKHITRVVRAEGSGTTYQFKNYLASIVADGQGHNPHCGPTWAELRPIEPGNAEEKPNTSWPEGQTESEAKGEECGRGTPVTRAAGGGAVVETVNSMEGAVGYASLSDVVNKGGTAAPIQNGVIEGEPTYAEPSLAGNVANCEATEYSVPETAQVAATGQPGTNVDWSTVFGADPTIAERSETAYPLCTLTYDLAWDNYSGAGFPTNPTTVTNTVKDYISEYILTAEGQTAINGTGYSELPVGTGAGTNVLEAARFAAGMI